VPFSPRECQADLSKRKCLTGMAGVTAPLSQSNAFNRSALLRVSVTRCKGGVQRAKKRMAITIALVFCVLARASHSNELTSADRPTKHPHLYFAYSATDHCVGIQHLYSVR
jgi:hypothetical protein